MKPFSLKTKIMQTSDMAGTIIEILAHECCKKALIILDQNILKLDQTDYFLSKVKQVADIQVYVAQTKEPTTTMVNEGKIQYEKYSFDMLIGIGGGSILDLTKALSVMLVNEGITEDYHGTGKPFIAGMKKILIPTTSGTGSEVTPGAVLVNPKTNFKRGIGGSYVQSDYALLCPEITLSMPPGVLISTSMDALAHAVESFTAKPATNITQMFAKEAFTLIFNTLPKALHDLANIEYRKQLLLGSCLAGVSIGNADTGACHAMAYPLGIYHGVAHGEAVARLLPGVVETNVNKGYFGYSELYKLIDGSDGSLTNQQAAMRFSQLLSEFSPLLELKTDFSSYGINEGNYKFLAERGLDLKPALLSNPVEFVKEDAEKVLKQLL